MKTKLFSMFFLVALVLMATETLPSPPTGYTNDGIYADSVGLWTAGLGNQVRLFARLPLGGSSFLPVVGIPGAILLNKTLWRGDVYLYRPYSKGDITYYNSQLGPVFSGFPASDPAQLYFNRVVNGVLNRMCVSFGSNTTTSGQSLKILGGMWDSYGGKVYFSAMQGSATGLYSLAKSSGGGSCTFDKLFDFDSNYRIVHAYGVQDGRFIAEMYRYPATTTSTFVAIISASGQISQIISSDKTANPKVVADGGVEMIVDANTYFTTVLFQRNGSNFVMLITPTGEMKEFELSDFFSSGDKVSLSGFQGKFAVFTGGRQRVDTIVLLDTVSGAQQKIVSGGSVNGTPVLVIEPRFVTVSSDGSVYFGLLQGVTLKLFREPYVLPPPPPPKPEYTKAGLVSVFYLGQDDQGCKDAGQGSVMALYGKNLSSEFGLLNTLVWPTILANTKVLLNGQPVPLHMVSNQQINLQIPYDVVGVVKLQVVTGSVKGPEVTLEVKELAPCFLRIDGQNMYIDQSGVMYATGLGQTSPTSVAGTPAKDYPLSWTTKTPKVVIDNKERQVVFSGLTPRFVGLYQVNTIE